MRDVKKDIFIPKELIHFHNYLKGSATQVAIIEPLKYATLIHESKFAGIPYLPKGITHPKDDDGQFMRLLAQINFSEFQLDHPFPLKGILQFYISQQCSSQVKPNAARHYFHVQYVLLNEIDDTYELDFSYMNRADFRCFPIRQEMKLHFNQSFEPVSIMDYRLKNYFNQAIMNEFITLDERSFHDIYLVNYLAADHKIGGYPYFIEHDFRESFPHLQHYDTLLLQIVSNDEQQIMWGDSGIISFFINSEKLQRLDFSDIYFHLEEY
ncbi:YwqG family protein [Solibacillus sp. FSL K6-1523]|uniref:YwqG family protein n=1 Tax=Solibacillus sp. FSL K6-1523 TaxID=2921471 RepID=UPI0030FCA547